MKHQYFRGVYDDVKITTGKNKIVWDTQHSKLISTVNSHQKSCNY